MIREPRMAARGRRLDRRVRAATVTLVVASALFSVLPGRANRQAEPAPRRAVTAPARQAPAVTFPFEFYRNAIWWTARVNGSRPLHVLFDTAAGSCVLDRAVADELRLPVLTEFDQANAGSGDQPTRISIRAAASIAFAGVTLDLPQVPAISHDEVAATYGASIDAIVGYPLMARYVVEIDFDRRTIALHEPSSVAYSGAGAVLPLEIPAGRREPIVRATIAVPGRDAIDGAFLVDEPHPRSVLFATPFWRGHDLLSGAPPMRLIPAGAMGVGGRTPYRVGRLDRLQIGPFTLKAPPAGFAEARGGAFARTDIAGIIGGEILRRFRVTLDVPHGRMILEPGKAFDEPFDWDSSGLRLRAPGPRFRDFEVVDLVPGSPAADAGIRPGDRVAALDGRPASLWTLGDMEQALQAPGREHRLTIARAGRVLAVKFTTRRLV